MNIIFFLIVIVAEIIVATSLISYIKKIDNKVCVLNNQIIKYNCDLKIKLVRISECVNIVAQTIVNFIRFVEKNTTNCSFAFSKTLIVIVLSIVFKIPFIHLANVIDVYNFINDLLK